MNLLEIGFLLLNVLMLVFGYLINYVNYILPQSLCLLFRYGRANISEGKPQYVRSIEVPKRWFWHFYLYAVAFQLLVFLTVLFAYSGSNDSWLFHSLEYVGERPVTVSSTSTILATILFLIHLSRRLYETLYVSIYSNTKMNIIHYLLGFLHYTGAILCLVAHCSLFSSRHSIKGIISEDLGTKEIVGACLFLLGNYVQNRAHVGFANLRKDKKEVTGHKIPRGGLFEYISCPNYFGEILLYVGIGVLFGLSNSSWNQCMYWVICNQITSGIMNHLWYIEKFKDYPKERKAIIPFIL